MLVPLERKATFFTHWENENARIGLEKMKVILRSKGGEAPAE